MKKIILVLLLAVGVFTAFGCAKKVDIAAETSAVKAALGQITQAKEKEDIALLEQFMATDPDIVVVGSDSKEFFIGWVAVKDAMNNIFKQADNIKFNVRRQAIKIDATGDTAWFAELVDFSATIGDKAVVIPDVRYTGTLTKKDGKWLLVQSHMSVPNTEVEKKEPKKEEGKDKKVKNGKAGRAVKNVKEKEKKKTK